MCMKVPHPERVEDSSSACRRMGAVAERCSQAGEPFHRVRRRMAVSSFNIAVLGNKWHNIALFEE